MREPVCVCTRVLAGKQQVTWNFSAWPQHHNLLESYTLYIYNLLNGKSIKASTCINTSHVEFFYPSRCIEVSKSQSLSSFTIA